MSAHTPSASGDPALVHLFEALFRGSAFPAALMSPEGRVLAVNAGLETLANIDLTGHSLLDHLDPAQTACLRDFLKEQSAMPAGPMALRWAIPGGLKIDLHLSRFAPDGADGAFAYLIHAVPCAVHSETPSLPMFPRDLDRETSMERLMRTSLELNDLALWCHCPATGEAWHSDVWFKMLGLTPEQGAWTLDTWLSRLHPEDADRALAAFTDHVEGRTDRYQADFRIRHQDGHWIWLSANGMKVDRSDIGLPMMVSGIQADISDRKLAETKMAESARLATEHRDRLNNIADNAPTGLFEYRIDADGHASFRYASDAVLDIVGVTRADVQADGDQVFMNLLPKYREELEHAIAVSARDLSLFEMRAEFCHPERGHVWLVVKSRPVRRDDGCTTWFGTLYDATAEIQREEALQNARDHALEIQQQMETLAMQDALTGLSNRRRFDMVLSARKARKTSTSRGGDRMTLIRIDLDHFKYVNDNLGHDAGDAVLCHVAQCLKHGVRDDDEVFRLGGDEFSILLDTDGTIDTALEIVARIQALLEPPFMFGGQICRFGASFGIAIAENSDATEAELNTFADVALYQAKARGRNRVEVFTSALHRHVLESRHLASELEEAIEREEFIPHYQPQICARTGALAGLETLARWNHPERGILSPAHFLDVADQIHIVPLIDQMVFARTREVLSTWRAQNFIPPKISFNVSSSRMKDHSVLSSARALLDDGVTVAFELLESILLEEETAEFRHQLDALRDMGIQIEIDDFGSGHASIIGLMECSPETLKIDRRLVAQVSESQENRHLVRAIVGMAKALGISVTVEGVETQEQADILGGMGCDVFQGYLFSKPLSADDLLTFARRRAASSAA